MGLLDGLISHWKLNEASGTRNDSHGTNHLTDNNTVLSATGKIGDAADFERDNGEYLSVADNATFTVTSFTIAAWVWIESVSAVNTIAAKSDHDDNWSTFNLRTANPQFNIAISNNTNNNNRSATTFGTPALSTWHFVVAWFDADADTLNIQINNGTVDSSTGITWTPGDSTGVFAIGGRSRFGNDCWDGLIDSVSLWNRALSSTERTDLYNGGSGLDYEAFGANDYSLTAAAGSYSLAGQAADLHASATRLAAGTGSYGVVGVAATLRRSLPFTAATGTYTLTGQAATLTPGKALAANPGSYTLTGNAAAFGSNPSVVAVKGTYAIVGSQAGLSTTAPLVPIAAGPPTYWFQIRLGPSILDWQDFTGRFISASIRRGRDSVLAGTTPGTMRVEVDNYDGAFDPTNDTSPYYPDLKLGCLMRIGATYNSVDYFLGYAYLDSLTHQRMGFADSNVVLEGVDAFDRFAGFVPAIHFGNAVTLQPEGSGERIHRLLQFIPWDSTAEDISAGEYEFLYTKALNNQSVLDAISEITVLERGLFFVDGRGYAVFIDKFDRLATQSRGTFASIGSAPNALPIPTDYQVAYRRQGIYNVCQTHRARYGQSDISASDSTSIDAYGRRTYNLSPNLADELDHDGRAQDWCTRFVAAFKDPRFAVTRITIDPYADSASSPYLWWHLLDGEVGDRLYLQLNDLPGTRGGSTYYGDYHIGNLEHRIQFGSHTPHTVSWGLELREGSTY